VRWCRVKDDYEIIKSAFEKYIVEEDRDLEGNPILKVKIGNVKITFYFIVDEYRDEARFDDVIVVEEKRGG
jgi:hypothetical protein